jgi:hypothetical protein
MSPRRSEVAIAFTTMLELEGLRDAFGDVNLRFQAVDASVRFVGDHQNTTNAATTRDKMSSDEMRLTFYLQRKGLGLGHFCSLKQ